MADFKLVFDSWDAKVDPYVRLAVALIETEPDNAAILGFDTDVLELLLQLKPDTPQTLLDELKVPGAYRAEGALHVTATMNLVGYAPGTLRKRIEELHARVARLKLAVRQQPRLVQSLRDMGPGDPPWGGMAGSDELDGRGVIVGVIDDGCAFAHRNFLEKASGTKPVFKSRVLHLWDQSDGTKKKGGWKAPPDFGYGSALRQAQLDAAIAAHVDNRGTIDERAVYESIDYMVESGAHGSHVLDIAAGNGQSVTASRGVASKADIIFVQIPRTAIGHPGDSAITSYILDGVAYIFARAREAKKPAVVNISYGGYGGPHDGSSLIERGIDELLAKENGRAVVISAGNGLNADCHAADTIQPGKSCTPLTWIVGENDPTLNVLEVWYNGNARFAVTLTPPGGPSLGPLLAGGAAGIQADGKFIGWMFHRTGDPGNQSNHIVIALRPTHHSSSGAQTAPAPAGAWKVQLANVGPAAADFHAWIERDDAGTHKAGMTLQSKFAAADSARGCTLGSLATGELTIGVGAYNTATQEVSVYSACGPTRDGRPKPDVCAPAEEDAASEGILSVAALSSQPSRMNGTSAAAPHVAGLVALLFQRAGAKWLSAAEVLEFVKVGARTAAQKTGRRLRPNSRWRQDDGIILANCTGEGKVNAGTTLAALASKPNP